MNKNWFSLYRRFIEIYFCILLWYFFPFLGKSSIQIENYRNIVMQKVYGFYKIENICGKNIFLLAKYKFSEHLFIPNFVPCLSYSTWDMFCRQKFSKVRVCFTYRLLLLLIRKEEWETRVHCTMLKNLQKSAKINVFEIWVFKYIFKSSLWL